jgi:hypothetical protein
MRQDTTGTGRPRPIALGAALLLSAAFVVVVPLDLLPWLRGPAPYPPEWQWELRSPLAFPKAPTWAVAALVLAAIAASFTRPLRRREGRAAPALVAAAVVLGSIFPLALLAREPGGALRTLLSWTSSLSITSYHTAAISDDARDPVGFVRRHADLLPDLARTAKHAATHPPGPVLFFRGALALTERSPALTDALLDAAGLPRRDFAPPRTRPARAAALLGALALSLLAALTAWPLAALGRALGLSPLAAARAALAWSLLPGPALIAPRFDAAIALPVVAFAAATLATLRSARGTALAGRAVAAGAWAGGALALSYGAAAFLAIAGLAAAAADAARARGEAAKGDGAPPARSWRARFAVLAAAAVTAVALAFGLPAALGGEPVRAMRAALAIHRDAYTAPRGYAAWLLFNPVDFAALAGPPVALLSLAAAARAARGALSGRGSPPAAAFGAAVVAGIVLLTLTGLTRGEVGRIWIPLMPLLLPALAQEDDSRALLPAAVLVSLATLAIAAAWRL